MSSNRGWYGRHDRRYQHDRHCAHYDSSSSYQGYGNGSSYTQPYAYDSNWAYAQPSYGYSYWRDNPYYAPHPYQSSADYGRIHHQRYANDGYLPEHSYHRQRRQRSDSPHRQYHTRAERSASPPPYTTPPSFHWKTPVTPALPTKTPPPPPLPALPDPAYMTLSSEPSHSLSDPRVSRKLLILDLNGTLLIRSQHNPRARHKVAHTSPGPRLRAVQPRPYIPAFCAYLFAPETRAWLDTMVWSSAQPHSVADMVDKVFGDSKCELVAVWSRESLGLSKEEYFRKSQTTKDLTKPWTLLPLNTGSGEPSVRSEADSTAEETGLAPSVTHSAMTTLLLDDSPAKARLQPYNHVCIPEYDAFLRAKDLERYERERVKSKSIVQADNEPTEGDPQAQGQEIHTPGQKERARRVSSDISSSSSESDLSVEDLTPAPAEESSVSAERIRMSSRHAETYDPTLLAVIGILDEIKSQSSVAGWIRTGGLYDIVHTMPGEMTAPSGGNAAKGVTPPSGRAAKRLAKKESRKAAKQLVAEKQRVAGNGARHAHDIPRNDESDTAGVPAGSDLPGDVAQMWFSDENTFEYWVGRGREALERLGIEAVHGVSK